jgi:hypothetical protein
MMQGFFQFFHNSAPALGSFSLGVTIGWLVRFFLERFVEFNAKILSTVVTVMVGGSVIGFLNWVAPVNADSDIFWYPVGLPVGLMLIYPVVLHFDKQFALWGESDKQWAAIWARQREEKYLSRDLDKPQNDL